MNEIKKFVRENRAIVGMILGFIIGLLIITINFWRTLVLVLFSALGYWLFSIPDAKDRAYRIVEKIFAKSRK